MPRIAISALLAALLTVGTACGGSEEPGAGPTAAPGSSPTETATTAVAAATGPVLDMPLSSVRIPEGWRVLDQIVTSQQDGGDDAGSVISLGEIESFGGQLTPDELVNIWYDTTSYPLKPKELPVTELDGVEAYHLAGKVQKLNYLEELGAVVDDMMVSLRFEFTPEISPQERGEIVDSVVATFRWK